MFKVFFIYKKIVLENDYIKIFYYKKFYKTMEADRNTFTDINVDLTESI